MPVVESRVPDEHDAGCGSAWLPLDAVVGSATSVILALAVLQVPVEPGRSDAVQPHSAGCFPARFHFFFLCVGLSPQHCQDGVSQQDEGHVPIPGPKTSHFILIQPDFSFCLFIAFFDPPSTSSHAHQFGKGGVSRAVRSVVRPLAWIRETASDQDPMEPLLACGLLLREP